MNFVPQTSNRWPGVENDHTNETRWNINRKMWNNFTKSCSLVLLAFFSTVNLLLSCSPRPSHHPVFDCLQNNLHYHLHLQYQGVNHLYVTCWRGHISIAYNTILERTMYSEEACWGKSSVHLSEPWQTREAAIRPLTGHSCLFSACLAIHAVNYAVKFFLFVPNEKHTLINLVWHN